MVLHAHQGQRRRPKADPFLANRIKHVWDGSNFRAPSDTDSKHSDSHTDSASSNSQEGSADNARQVIMIQIFRASLSMIQLSWQELLTALLLMGLNHRAKKRLHMLQALLSKRQASSRIRATETVLPATLSTLCMTWLTRHLQCVSGGTGC